MNLKLNVLQRDVQTKIGDELNKTFGSSIVQRNDCCIENNCKPGDPCKDSCKAKKRTVEVIKKELLETMDKYNSIKSSSINTPEVLVLNGDLARLRKEFQDTDMNAYKDFISNN